MTVEITEETFDDFIENNEFVLVDCWAPWCGPCRRMGPIVDELSTELEGKVAVGKLNTDEAPGISARFGITAIPTLLLFKNKVAIEPLVGLRPKQDILAYMAASGMVASAKKEGPAEEHFAAMVTDSNFDEFVKSKGYALVDCWAPWCKPCVRMGPIIEGLAKISQDDIAVGKLNVDENPMTSMRFNIQSIPTVLIYKNGKQVDVIVGLSPALTPEVLREHILSF
jgi:thioredoxin 1